MSPVKAGILGAGDVTTSCPSKDNVSGGGGGGGGDLTPVPAEKGGDSEKRDQSSVLPA